MAHPGALLVSMKRAGFCPRDLTRLAQPITGQVRDHIIGLARQHGLEIEMVRRKNFRQEDRAAEILKTRGHHPGWVHIFAVKESATVYDTRHARADGYAQIIARRGACIHYYQVNSHLGRRYAGLRLKHSFGPASVKLYNRPGGILRMEMTTYDVSFFRHYRQVVHRDGTKEQMLATRKKSIDSLRDLAELMQAGVHRYSQWLASLAEHTAGHREYYPFGPSGAGRPRSQLPGLQPLFGGGRTGAPTRVERRTCGGRIDGTPVAPGVALLESRAHFPAAQTAAMARVAAQGR